MHRPRRGIAERLRTALRALFAEAGKIQHHIEKPWASITFSGTRHTLRLVFDGPDQVEAGERFIADLPEHEFTIPGQLVAEANVCAVEHTLVPQPRMLVECELLLLEEA